MKLASITNDTDQLRLKKIVVAIISIFLLVNLDAGIGANLLDMDRLVIHYLPDATGTTSLKNDRLGYYSGAEESVCIDRNNCKSIKFSRADT